MITSFILALLIAVPAFGASVFTGTAKHIELIANHPEVWQNYGGPILSVERIDQGADFTTYQFKTRESKPILQPHAMVGGRSLADPDFKPTPENPIVTMVTVGYRPEIRYFRATVRVNLSDDHGPTSGTSLIVDSIVDVTDEILCADKLAPGGFTAEL